MTVQVGINGFGRMGRLVMRAVFGRPDVSIVHVNDPAGDAASFAHLLQFDSVQGSWNQECEARHQYMIVDGQPIATSAMTKTETTSMYSTVDWPRRARLIDRRSRTATG